MLFAAPLLLCSSCGIEDVEAEDGAIVFELYDTEGNLIEGLQSMRFGTTATYTLKSAFVTYTVATPPTGWKCTVIPSSRSCSVTAPPASDLGAKASGDVVIEIQSQAGRTETYTLAVAALENDITLTFDEETTSKTHVFSYGKSMEFEFTSENTASLDVSVPKGWTYTADVDAGLLTVTAPTQEEADPAMEGSVKVTPLSVRGTAGEGASIPVELSTKLPIISFAEADYKFAFGEQRDIPCTVTNVATCDITALKGWDIALDIKNSVLKVTAPADGADCTGAGTIEFAAVSAEELTASFSVRLSWKGISTPQRRQDRPCQRHRSERPYPNQLRRLGRQSVQRDFRRSEQYDHRQAGGSGFEGTRPVSHARRSGRDKEPLAGGQHVRIASHPRSRRHAGRL